MYTNYISNLVVAILTAVSSIAILYYKNIAIVCILIYLWILIGIQNKRYHTKMQIYQLIEKEKKSRTNGEFKVEAKSI